MPSGKPGTFTRCTFDECEGKSVGRGLCRKHYTRWHVHGDPSVVVDQSRGSCSVDGCERAHKAHGLCEAHYRRLQRRGDPLVQGKPRRPGGPEARFWAQVDLSGPTPEHRPELGPCWQWTGGISSHGYGLLSVNGRSVHAHSWAYRRFIGPLPKGIEPDHLCRNRACVRFVGHLEAVTHRENTLRGEAPSARNARKTHCPRGHPYDDQNTYRHKRGGRVCKTCFNGRRRKPEGYRRPLKTHCPSGHPYVEGNIYWGKGGTIRLCKACKTARNHANAARKG